MGSTKQFCRALAGAAIVVCAYWNLITFDIISNNLSPRETEEIVIQERRLAPVRQLLIKNRYDGEVAFATRRSLAGLPPAFEDDKHWGQAQYVLLPWVLDRDKRDLPFVIADFWDGPSMTELEHLSKVYEGDGLVLFQRKQLP